MNKRTNQIEIRVTPEEKALIMKKAKECGLSVSEFVRMLATGFKPKLLPSVPYIDCIRVLSDLYNVLRERSDSEATDQIKRLVMLMTESFTPTIIGSDGDH
jgi:hypothetical protein